MTTWLRRRCLHCGREAETMMFKTGICEHQMHCPTCGSDQGEDLPPDRSKGERYVRSEPLAVQVDPADQEIVLTEAAGYLVREAERRFGSPLRLTVKALFLEAIKRGFHALDQVRELERRTGPILTFRPGVTATPLSRVYASWPVVAEMARQIPGKRRTVFVDLSVLRESYVVPNGTWIFGPGLTLRGNALLSTSLIFGPRAKILPPPAAVESLIVIHEKGKSPRRPPLSLPPPRHRKAVRRGQ